MHDIHNIYDLLFAGKVIVDCLSNINTESLQIFLSFI